ncbi:MAG: inositol-3-phosphate synthase [Gemmataceae bacterium]|nr:inositol-3-phosphate synthase [Gemmataceae bacterium]
MSNRRIGLWLVGAWGGVCSTAVLGLAALRKNLIDSVGLVSEKPEFAHLDLDGADSFVIGGHDIRKSSYWQSVSELHQRANIFDERLLEGCKADLDEWDKNIRPGTIYGSGPTISKLADWSDVQRVDTPRAAVQRIQQDLKDFQARHKLDQVIVANASSTEPPFQIDDSYSTIAKFEAALDNKESRIPASTLYAWASLDLGMPHVNFTPSLGASFPAAMELCQKRKTTTTGKDGKTGETLMKTVLAPMFKHRNLQVLSWVGHNIFGNRDGVVLDDPVNKASKVQTKDQVISSIVGYKPNTLVTIEYIPSMDDWKTAWNHIHYRGFLNTKMILQFIWQGCDSILAAPLLLDSVRFTALCQRRDEYGAPRQLACFFKSPMGTDEHDFFVQYAELVQYARAIKK